MEQNRLVLGIAVIAVCLLVPPGHSKPTPESEEVLLRSSYVLRSSVMGSAGSPGSSANYTGNGTACQPTPIGIGSAGDKVVYAGFWSKPGAKASVLEGTFPGLLTTELLGSFPNPFRGSTVIEYAVAKECFVEITVFDIRGRRVRTLACEVKQPGRYTTSWDGKDETGHDTSPGLYFHRMSAGDFRSVKKMILLK